MLLASLLDHVSQKLTVTGDTKIEVLGVVNDSQHVKPGFVFVAIPGVKQDGTTFAKEAVERGAVALLAAKLLPFDVNAQVVAADVREALGEMVSAFYSHPSRSMRMIGVTGTNGKTTVTYLLESILKEAGFSTGLIGTIETRYAGTSRLSTHTSPDSPELQSTLNDMREAGVSACVMELSSHALTLKRPAGCWLDGVGVTNITHDHLDFHKTWESYRDSKLQAFELLRDKPNSFVVANMHDPSFPQVRARWTDRLFAFGFSSPAEIRLLDSRQQEVGNELHIATPGGELTVTTQLPGVHNIANALTAVGLAFATGVGLEQIGKGLAKLKSVPGRFQYVRGKRFSGVVDFAHNPDGLLQLLTTARTLTKGKTILVFGCQGERDVYKRPVMGEIAARWADEVILTTDDWFNEDPRAIFSMVIAGFRRLRGDGPDVIWRRDDAIFEAVSRAQPEDLIIVAGRGPERKLVMGQLIYDFDDVQFLKFCIDERERGEGLV